MLSRIAFFLFKAICFSVLAYNNPIFLSVNRDLQGNKSVKKELVFFFCVCSGIVLQIVSKMLYNYYEHYANNRCFKYVRSLVV